MDWLVSTEWLSQRLDSPDLVVLDCSWYLPDTGRFAVDDFLKGHIPGAQFADLNEISDPASPYANMLPTEAQFAEAMGQLGIGNATHVIVYDAGYVSARLWWMFRVFGHEKVSILDGGWRKWCAEGRPAETGHARPATPRHFEARLDASCVATLQDIKDAVEAGDTTLLDARTPSKFQGLEGSGYPGVPGGYMPGAINIHWGAFYDAEKGHVFVDPKEARRVFESAGADLSRPVITTCGSGVTAAILGFMLERNGHEGWKLYDGSWHEWGQQPDTPKLTAKP